MNVKTKGIDMNDQVLSGCVNRFTKKSCIDIGMRQKKTIILMAYSYVDLCP